MQQSLRSLLAQENVRVIPPGSYDPLGLRANLNMPPIGETLSYMELLSLYQAYNITSLEKMAYFAAHSFKWNHSIYVYEINYAGHICCICVKN